MCAKDFHRLIEYLSIVQLVWVYIYNFVASTEDGNSE